MKENPVDWIADSSWPNIYTQVKGLEIIPGFEDYEPFFMENPDKFRHIYDSAVAH